MKYKQVKIFREDANNKQGVRFRRYSYNKAAGVMLILVASLFLVSCGGKESDGEKKVLTAKDNPEEVLKAANEQYAKEKMRGSHGTYVYTYMDGSSEEEQTDVSFDVEKGIEQLVYTDGEEEISRRYNVKEKNEYYSYELDPETNEWIRYKQDPDEDGKTTYEVQEEGVTYTFDEKFGYENVKYSNEGEEEFDGKDAIKIKVTGQMGGGQEEEDTITRESIFKDYEITEEAVGYIDGLSEALDKYVAAMNASENSEPMTFETFIWVEAKTHRPLQNKTTVDMGNVSGADVSADMQEFEDNLWKVYSLMSDMDEGLTVDEALENIKKNEPQMEEELEAEKELMEEEGLEEDFDDDAMTQKEVISTEVNLYGDNCRKIEELPEYYTEITQEEYYNGEY